jgi:hypothetical protein
MADGSSSIVESIPVPTASVSDPPYDPSADIAERTRFVRERFGNTTRVRIEGDAFVVADPDHGVLFDPGVSLTHRAIHSLLMPGHFQGPPDRAVTVLLFSSHPSFVAFSKGALWVRSPRALQVVPAQPSPRVDREGIASLFEHPSFSRPMVRCMV